MEPYEYVYDITVRVHSDHGPLTEDEQDDLMSLIQTENLTAFAATRDATVIEVHGPTIMVEAATR